ncbi:MAG: response regulator transcription factor [Aphanocapsa lilacina HA4352-LM1]|jgi:DNA-binding response OmpR family regulator|nr:response regulator transcription factor [Aphanocapsa lilacina HA4352-LM1]
MPNTAILVVEDDPLILETVRRYLEHAGHRCHCAADGWEADRLALRHRPDLVVLDWMLPGVDGLALCERWRKGEYFAPVLMLTARTEEDHRVRALASGADDYLDKPFSAKELVARVQALLRRAYASGYRDCSPQNGLLVDRNTRQVQLHGRPIDLRAREFDLLAQLADHPGRVYSRDELLEWVWGYDFEGGHRTIDVHVRKLREKLEPDPTRPVYVLTVWGVGYKFAGPPR